MGELTVALPRSALHLEFLAANAVAPDVVVYRDQALARTIEDRFPGRALWLGREALPGRSLTGLLAARRFNRTFYHHVATLLDWRHVTRFIIFLEGEPLERYLLSLVPQAAVELWEDGLSHYLDLTADAWYRARALAQLAAGFYGHGILQRRIDRSAVRVRDRFGDGSLGLPVPAEPGEKRDTILVIGSPLVEDGIIARRRLVAGLRQLAAASPIPLEYLAHPRENRVRLTDDLGPITLLDDGGLQRHAAATAHRAYVSAMSTGLVDLGRYERSLFVPLAFGLRRAHRALSGWSTRPVALAGRDDLASQMARIAG